MQLVITCASWLVLGDVLLHGFASFTTGVATWQVARAPTRPWNQCVGNAVVEGFGNEMFPGLAALPFPSTPQPTRPEMFSTSFPWICHIHGKQIISHQECRALEIQRAAAASVGTILTRPQMRGLGATAGAP